MAELCRNADRAIEEWQKTDAVKASDCSSKVERLKVLSLTQFDADLLCTVMLYPDDVLSTIRGRSILQPEP